MVESLPQIIVTIAMLVIGVVGLFYPNEFRASILKVIGEKGFSADIIKSKTATRSMRISGFFAILTGLFSLLSLLWVFWQH